MQLKVIDEDQTRRNNIIELCRPYDDGVTSQVTDISATDLQDINRQRIIFLHWNNYSDRAIHDLSNVSKEVILYSGGSFRDLSDAEQGSGKVFKIHRSIDRGESFSGHLTQGFIEILEYFKNGKKGALPSLFVKTSYPDALVAYYLAEVAKEHTLSVELKKEAEDDYKKLKDKHGCGGAFDRDGIKELFVKMATI